MRSLKSNTAWAFVANITNATLAWLILLLLTKVGNATEVGVFALAQAVALPIHIFYTFKMRTLQSTDHQEEYTGNEYRCFSILCAIASFGTTAVIVPIYYRGEIYILILILALSYSFIIYREFYISLLLKNERNDRIAFSNMAQGILSLILFFVGYVWTRKLWVGAFGILSARMLLTLYLDSKICQPWNNESIGGAWFKCLCAGDQVGRLYALLQKALPLGIAALLTTLITSIPRVMLDSFEDSDIVGYYAVLTSLLVVVNLFVSSIGQSVMPKLSRLYLKDRPGFIKRFYIFLFLCIGFALAITMLGFFFGESVLTLLFAPDYAAYHKTFFILMIAGGFMAAFSAMNIGISAQRIFRVQFPISFICVIVTAVASYALIPKYGIDGAAFAYALCNLAGLLLTAIVFFKALRARLPAI